ncbi:MAG: tetratricopeptide repeat protein [Anaerolineales bacterium]|nr:tetratricopeptide repeat protein [Anaerolineales bacterium]
MMQSIDPAFIQALKNGLTHWQAQTRGMTDDRLRQVDAERANLLQIVQSGLVLPALWADTAVLMRQAFPLIERRGYGKEWISLLERLLAHADALAGDVTMSLLNQLGQLYRLNRRLTDAIALHQQAKARARTAGDAFALAEANYNLSEAHFEDHAYAEAEACGQAALQTWVVLPDADRWVAATLITLAKIARARGEADASVEILLRAVAIRRREERPLPLMRALNDLALAYKRQGAFDLALACFQEALAILEPTVYELDKVLVHLNVGSLHFQRGDWSAARMAFRQADTSYLRKSGDLRLQASLVTNLGNVLLKQSEYAEAEESLQRAQRLWQQLANRLELGNTVGTLGELYLAWGRPQDACACFDEAIQLLRQFPDNAWAQKLRTNFTALRRQAESAGDCAPADSGD